MKKLGAVPAVVLALSAMASTACATGYGYGQDPYRDRAPYNSGYYREVERRAYDNGFREGVRQGERDGRSNRRYEPQGHSEWRNANGGFRREYGDQNLYRRNFRSGFEAGYSQSYRNYNRGYYRR
jgi:predicted small secreted protein